MGLHTSFDLLSEIIEHYERDGHSIRHADVASDERGSLHATLELPISTDDEAGLAPTTATMTDDGGFELSFRSGATELLPDDVAAAVSAEEPSLRVVGDGDLVLVVTLVVDADADPDLDTARESTVAPSTVAPSTADVTAAEGPTPEARFAAVRDESVPPYEDTDYLRRLYDACDTFSEMSRLIEMDVAAETVRRYMIDAGIHSPNSYRTAHGADAEAERSADSEAAEAESEPDSEPDSESAAESTDGDSPAEAAPEESTTDGSTDVDGVAAAAPVEPRESIPDETLVTDGIGLPGHLDIDDVVDAVTESSTVYEVQRRLDLEQQRTWDLLQQLGLLELLLGRLSEGQMPTASYEAVASRIRQRTTGGA